MTTIIITEKTSQKKDLVAAIGNEFGQIFPAEGHLLSLQEPQSVNGRWGKWSFDLLKPDDFYPTCPAPDGSPSARGKLKAIEVALKKASRVILATDCDREGQLIGEELLRHYEFSGPVGRAMFTAQDEKTLRDAFKNLEPNENYLNLGQAAMARQQADQVYNLSLTRAATVALKHPGEYGAIGIGRVKTPTMAIVCIRELEILEFTPQDYYQIVATAKTAAGDLQLRYAPKEKILYAEDAEQLRAQAEGFEGPLSAIKKTKRTKPPKLLDLPELQKICGRKWGWSATKTLEVAQELYDGDGKKIQTYPRAESRYLAENQIDDVEEIVRGLKTLESYQPLDLQEPIIRKGKSGHFSDAGLKGVSHHAIVPNKNTMDKIHNIYPRLSADEKKMFDLVASSYLAILMPDYVYESTTVAIKVPGKNEEILTYKVTGNIPKEPGWRSVFTDVMEKKEEHAGELPPVQDGDQACLSPVEIDTKKTKAPSRFNEGSLIDAMQNAWRFVADKNLQERLKEAKGIGTPATRAAIITGLKRQNFLTQSGKNIVPTPAGLTLYKTLKATAPELVDPGVTALWEMKLDDILVGKQSARQVWDEIGEATSRLINAIRDNAASAPKIITGMTAPKGAAKFGGGKPTEKMIATAKSIATRKNIKPPKKYDTDFQACKDFLDEHLGGNPLLVLEKRLGSGVIKGLGPSAAKILVTAFGTEVFNVVEETPERLSEVKGIGPKIVNAAIEKKAVRTLGKNLQTKGVAPECALRLFKTYGDEAAKIIAEDPYRIIRDIRWFGFDNVDCIAKSIGLKHDDPARVRAALFHAIDQAKVPRARDTLLNQLQSRLGIPAEQLDEALDKELNDENLYESMEDGRAHIYIERKPLNGSAISKSLKSLKDGPLPWPQIDASKALEWFGKQVSQPLNSEHHAAAFAVFNAKTMFLRAAPESGTSSVIKAIVTVLQAKNVKIKLAAPTHADAALIEDEVCEAVPLAKMLGWKSGTGKYKHNAKKPLDCQLLILDAVQKIDPTLLDAALQALPNESGVLLIGDPQYISTNETAILLESLSISGEIPSMALVEIEQAQQGSQRLQVLKALCAGENLATGLAGQAADPDVFRLAAKSPSEAIAKTLEVVSNRLPAKYGFEEIDDIQVICAAAGGELGSVALNIQLQRALNPQSGSPFVDRFGERFCVGDKVMMSENDFSKGLVGGEIGRIAKIEKDSQTLRVAFTAQTVEFQFDELDIVTLAYAIPWQRIDNVTCRATVLLLGNADISRQACAALNSARDLAVIIG